MTLEALAFAFGGLALSVLDSMGAVRFVFFDSISAGLQFKLKSNNANNNANNAESQARSNEILLLLEPLGYK
jgi:hypothetical protein